jgi:fructose-1,6-bisphosphatase/inositol monophosphatase family enzyme
MQKLLQKIADDVYKILRPIVHQADLDKTVGIGKGGDLTTRIDKLAENTVFRLLEKERIRLNVLSEEAGFIDNHADETLVIDPIDGTYNALAGIPVYSISLAIGTHTLSDVYIALVRNLATGETYEARRGKGATLNGLPIHVRTYNPKNSMFSLYLGRRASARSIELTRLARRIRALGSAALEMCLVAAGGLDLYYQSCEALRVTDVAASSLILREAGGEVYHEATGKPLNMKFDLSERVNIIAVGDKRIFEYHPIIYKISNPIF